MTLNDAIALWLWLSGLGLAAGLWRWVATLWNGISALRKKGGPNGAKRLLFARKVVETTAIGLVCLVAFRIGLFVDALPRPTTVAGTARIGTFAWAMIEIVALVSLYSFVAWVLEGRIDAWLERQYEKAQRAKWDGEERRTADE